MKDELSDRIMNKIDSNKIVPIPHWRFLLIRSFFWILAGLSVTIGSVAISAILFLLNDHRRHGFWTIPHEIKEILLIIPYLWILIFILFIFIALESIRYTKQGYRYRLRKIVGLSLILSFIFGLTLYFIGLGEITHNFSSRIYLYEYITYDSERVLNQPGIGRLSGIILKVRDKNNFSLVDFDGNIWQIHIASSTKDNSFIPEASSTIRMIGFFETSLNAFIPNSIHKWEE